MKKIILILALLSTLTSSAYDAQIDGIYYNINTSAKTATVTYRDENYNSYTDSVTIPAKVTYNGVTYSVTAIGSSAFNNCYNLYEVNIPNSVTIIGYSAFSVCVNLTSITIPNSVTSIEATAFYCCSRLTSISIPNSVTSIKDGAFYNCYTLTSVICEATSLPSTGFKVFHNLPMTSATLYVPASALDDYKATAPWRGFGNIVAWDPTEVISVESGKQNNVHPDGKYVKNGRIIIKKSGKEFDAAGAVK